MDISDAWCSACMLKRGLMVMYERSHSCFWALVVAALAGPMALATVRAADAVPHLRCEGEVCIEVVEVGDVGNAADAETGHGAVHHAFAIGRHEVTVGQYVTFLNAVAGDVSALPPDKRGALEDLWQEDMFATHGYVLPNGLISRRGNGTSEDPYVYRVPGHGYETARCAGYAANLNSVAASDARAFCSALI